MTAYTSTSHGHHCAAMMRYRPESADSKRIEIYPTSQWGMLGEYSGPENDRIAWGREALRRLNQPPHEQSRNDS